MSMINLMVCLAMFMFNTNMAFASENVSSDIIEVDGVTYVIIESENAQYYAAIIDCYNSSEIITIPSEIDCPGFGPTTVKEIAPGAFFNCKNTLKTIVFPETVEMIHNFLFSLDSQKSVQNVVFKGSKPNIDRDAFSLLSFNLYYDIHNRGWNNEDVHLGGASYINYISCGKEHCIYGNVKFSDDMPSCCNVDLIDYAGNVLIGGEFYGDHMSGIWFNFENVKIPINQFKVHVYNKNHSFYTDTYTISDDMEIDIYVP